LERIPDDSNVVICGLGVWIPLTTLLYCLEEGRSESLEQVVGLKQCDSQEAIQSVLTNIGHINALRLGVALWTRSGIDLKPEFVERFSLLKIGVLPSKSELDDWARKATDGIISEFPIELNPDTLLVLAAAISAKATWEQEFWHTTGVWCGKTFEGFLSRSSSDLNDVAVLKYRSHVYSRVIVRSNAEIDFHLIAGDASEPAGDVLAAACAALCGDANITEGEIE